MEQRTLYRDAHLTLDFEHKAATLDSRPLSLTRKEYDLLALLVSYAGVIIPRAEVLMRVWGYSTEIRTRTLGKASLETALRAVLAEGGNISVSWTMEKFIEVGDKATGTTVLHETYEKLAKHPTPVDVPTLMRRLGVVVHGQEPVTFDDTAELAWVRKGMTPAR